MLNPGLVSAIYGQSAASHGCHFGKILRTIPELAGQSLQDRGCSVFFADGDDIHMSFRLGHHYHDVGGINDESLWVYDGL